MKVIKILGPGCPRCEKLADAAGLAADQLGIEYKLTKIKDISQYPSYGLMLTPGLVIDDELVVHGKLATVDEIKELLGGEE